MRRHFSSSRGQTVVEFALLTPIVILLMVAILDFGAAMNRRIVLQHAAREGARMAAVSDDRAKVCAYTCDQAKGAVDGAITFLYTDESDPPDNPTGPGDNVELTLPAHWDLPILNNAFLGLIDNPIPSINLTAKGSARLERTVPVFPNCTCP